jgi:hypothetical protein
VQIAEKHRGKRFFHSRTYDARVPNPVIQIQRDTYQEEYACRRKAQSERDSMAPKQPAWRKPFPISYPVQEANDIPNNKDQCGFAKPNRRKGSHKRSDEGLPKKETSDEQKNDGSRKQRSPNHGDYRPEMKKQIKDEQKEDNKENHTELCFPEKAVKLPQNNLKNLHSKKMISFFILGVF